MIFESLFQLPGATRRIDMSSCSEYLLSTRHLPENENIGNAFLIRHRIRGVHAFFFVLFLVSSLRESLFEKSRLQSNDEFRIVRWPSR